MSAKYTITHAIEDGNVLRFHVDYFKPAGNALPKPGGMGTSFGRMPAMTS